MEKTKYRIIDNPTNQVIHEGEHRSVHSSAIGRKNGSYICWVTKLPNGVHMGIHNPRILIEETDSTLWIGEIPYAKDAKVVWQKPEVAL